MIEIIDCILHIFLNEKHGFLRLTWYLTLSYTPAIPFINAFKTSLPMMIEIINYIPHKVDESGLLRLTFY